MGFEVISKLLQLAGGVLISVGYIPQICQIIRTKSVKDLNVTTYAVLMIGIAFMEVYAIYLALSGEVMFLITNTLSLSLLVFLCALILKIKYMR